RFPLKSLSCASAPPRYPGQRATVLVTLATTAGTPTARSTGKVMSVPPPAKAFTAPASIAATKTAISSTSVISLSLRQGVEELRCHRKAAERADYASGRYSGL